MKNIKKINKEQDGFSLYTFQLYKLFDNKYYLIKIIIIALCNQIIYIL